MTSGQLLYTAVALGMDTDALARWLEDSSPAEIQSLVSQLQADSPAKLVHMMEVLLSTHQAHQDQRFTLGARSEQVHPILRTLWKACQLAHVGEEIQPFSGDKTTRAHIKRVKRGRENIIVQLGTK